MSAISGTESPQKKYLPLRWTYIALPAAILLLSVILAASFSPRLPAEVAYHFADGAPDRWLSRSAVIAWAIVPQLVLALIGLLVVSAAAMAVRQLPESPLMRRLLLIIGNIIALPQLIFTFAMLDIFLYNIYRIHLIPVWVFALTVMVLGGIVLGTFFMQAIRQTRKAAR